MSLRKLTIALATFLTLFFLVLILTLILFSRFSGFWAVLTDKRFLFSLRLSLTTATLATFIALLLAIPVAYALARYQFWGKRFIDTFTEMPQILSPVALGALLLIFFSSQAGQTLQKLGVSFVYTVAGIILAQFISVVGVAVRLLKANFEQIPTRLENVARSLGATPRQVFFSITLPLAQRAILASALLCWAKAIGEFGATITIAGSMAFRTETLPIAIFNALSGSETNKAAVLILILAATGLLILYLVRLLIGDGKLDWR